MRALTGLLMFAAVAAVPAAATAQEAPVPAAPLCQLSNPDTASIVAFQRQLIPYVAKARLTSTGQVVGGEATDAVREVLGDQYVAYWMDNGRYRWGVAFAPGPHDADSARAAIRARLATVFTPAEVDFLDEKLLLLPTPYTDAELQATVAALRPVAGLDSPFSGFGISCMSSDGFRVEIDVTEPETPELRARVEALLAPFGDKVVIRAWGAGRAGPIGPATVPGPPPGLSLLQQPPAQPRPAPKPVRELVTLPRTSGCARTVTVKRKAGQGVKRVRLQIGSRVSAGTAPRLQLKSRRSTVTVTVTLSDGTRVSERLRLRRCA